MDITFHGFLQKDHFNDISTW